MSDYPSNRSGQEVDLTILPSHLGDFTVEDPNTLIASINKGIAGAFQVKFNEKQKEHFKSTL